MRRISFAGAARISGAAALAAACLLAGGCSAGRADVPRAGASAPAPRELTVHRGRFDDRFLLTGQLAAVHADHLVVPRIPNWETTIRWIEDEGTVVKAGQRVVEFDTSAFAQDLGEKRLAWEQADADLAQAESDREAGKADTEFAVAQKTIAVEKARIDAAIPAEFLRGKDWQDNQLALSRAENELAKAKEDDASKGASSAETVHQKEIALGKARRELDAATQAMEGMVLTAPRDGILVIADHPWQGRKLQVGDSVWVGLPVVSLPDLSVMRVEAKLSDVDDGRVAPAEPVTCTLDAYPDRTFSGHIVEITPVAQEETGRSLRRAYSVKIELDASDADRMRPGMSVKVEAVPPVRDGVLLAPREGLDFSGDVPRARVAGRDPVPVKLGPCGNDSCIVLEGLAEGTRLKPAA